MLVSPQFPNLFKYSDLPSFDLASDAFMTLKDVLRRHKSAVCAHLGVHYTEFFQLYEMLLQSPNYVTRRQALKVPAPSHLSSFLRFAGLPPFAYGRFAGLLVLLAAPGRYHFGQV